MSNDNDRRQLRPVAQMPDLRAELAQAQQALLQAEAELSERQAAINAFRMHCRLKLDDLVDKYLALQTEKQAILTRWRLLCQERGDVPAGDDFWPDVAPVPGDPGYPDEEEPLMPTPTPYDKAAEKRLYRELARRFHPDRANTGVEQAYRTSVMASINRAYEEGDVQALYDLAGELDPSEVAELDNIETAAARKLREKIMTLKRRRRKAEQRLKVLMRENTARLWLKAQYLDSEDDNWWDEVRRELEQAIARRRDEIATLEARVAGLEAQAEGAGVAADR